jgi:Zn finger protein HypA/HybF involved in hydrogenase expression
MLRKFHDWVIRNHRYGQIKAIKVRIGDRSEAKNTERSMVPKVSEIRVARSLIHRIREQIEQRGVGQIETQEGRE